MEIKWRIISVALVCAFVCAACVSTNASALAGGNLFSVATPGVRPTSDEAHEAASVAREALARLPAAERLGEINDERLRRAVQTTYRAVVELADNRDPGKVARLNTKFMRAYASVERETARGAHKTCADNCRACDGQPCQRRCKATGKRFCGCKVVVFACVVAECVF